MSITLTLILAVATSFMLIQAQNNGDIRLVNSNPNRTNIGRVEIFLNESWGTICVKNLPHTSIQAVADTACRQLQFKNAYVSGTVKELGYTIASPSTPIHIGSITCPFADSDCSKDYPLHVLRCTVDKNVDRTTCTHDSDVAVYCYPESIVSSPYDGQVALYLPKGNKHPANVSISSGIVGIILFLNNSSKPGVMCGKGLDQNVANTACRQLGYTNARSFKTVSIRNTSNYKLTAVWDVGLNCKLKSYSCLSSCFSKKPTTHTGCKSVIRASCEFDLSLKNANPPGSPVQCDAKYCKRNSHTKFNEQSFSLPGTIITVVVITVIAAAFTACLTLTIVCCLVPGCLFYRKRSDGNKLDQYQKWTPSAAHELLITNK